MIHSAGEGRAIARTRGRLLGIGGLFACLLLLGACKADLYSNLTEVEANQMLAVLMTNGIPASKSNVGESFSVRVEESDMVRAIAALNAKGYPRSTRDSIGSVFQKSGIISSPFEERVRYIYALGEDVAQTLSEIDGVVTARVHVVLPDQPQLGQPVKPSSAAVFIKHEPTVDLEFFVPQIRRLVSSSIEGLDYSAVAVILTEALPAEVETPPLDQRTVEVMPGISVLEADAGNFWRMVYAAGAVVGVLLLLVLITGFAYLSQRRRNGTQVVARGADVPDAVLEPS